MNERKETSAEEALIVITLACAGVARVTTFMRRGKIKPARDASATDAILGHYRTRSGYDLSRFASDFHNVMPSAEMAA